MKVNYIEHLGSDLTVVNAARVSFDKFHDYIQEGDERLIRYLAKHEHWSPFAHPQIQLRYTIPIFIARQEFKHIVGFVRNEVSRRYVDDIPKFYLPDEWRTRPTGGLKQGSSDEIITEITPTGGWETTPDIIVKGVYKHAEWCYRQLIENNVCPEQARMVLPQAMYTSYIITGSLAAYARFYKLRSEAHAQKEIQYLAKMVAGIIQPLYPISWETLISSPLGD